MLRIGWFSSGRGPGSQALLQAVCNAIEQRGLPVQIAYVFCNRDRGEHEPADQFLDLARSHDLPVLTLSSNRFRRDVGGEIARIGEPLPAWRDDYDRAILKQVQPYRTDLAILAGYMLIAPELCRHMTLLNLHPAAPGGPIGIWQDVIWQLIDARAARSGITIFRATPELDAGPPLSFCTYSTQDDGIAPLWQDIEGRDLADLQASEGEELPLFGEIRRRGAAREAPLMIATLEALALGHIHLARDLTEADESPAQPLDLTQQVDSALHRGI